MSGQAANHGSGQPDPQLLEAIPRMPQRLALPLEGPCPIRGWDIWTAYELSWIDLHGKPRVAVATLVFSADSPRLIESKSLKLYLNAFQQTTWGDSRSLQQQVKNDLKAACGRPVEVTLEPLQKFGEKNPRDLEGDCLDELPVEISDYQVNPEWLQTTGEIVEEALTSHLFKSNCPLSGWPDWADIQVRYGGPKIDPAGLLRYLVSFRQHRAFHENCVERVFMDILNRCRPEKLSVYARFTRRGGLDINPFRTNWETSPPPNIPTARQ